MGEIKKVVNEVLDILELYSPIAVVKAFAKKAGKSLEDIWRTEEEPGYKKSGKPDADIAMQAANDLIQQWNADKDRVLDLDELMRDSYKKKGSAAIQLLRTQLGDDIILTGTWDEEGDMRELEEGELLDGEASAFVYKVGSYLVRQADCLYQDSDAAGIDYRERKPAGKDAIAAYREHSYSFESSYDFPYRSAKKVSAKYIGGGSVPSEEWQCVCFADHSIISWHESIKFICAVKGGKLSPDSREALYVLKNWMGDSHNHDYWCRFTPDGTVEKYQIYPLDNPFGIEPSKEPWEMAGKSEKETDKM